MGQSYSTFNNHSIENEYTLDEFYDYLLLPQDQLKKVIMKSLISDLYFVIDDTLIKDLSQIILDYFDIDHVHNIADLILDYHDFYSVGTWRGKVFNPIHFKLDNFVVGEIPYHENKIGTSMNMGPENFSEYLHVLSSLLVARLHNEPNPYSNTHNEFSVNELVAKGDIISGNGVIRTVYSDGKYGWYTLGDINVTSIIRTNTSKEELKKVYKATEELIKSGEWYHRFNTESDSWKCHYCTASLGPSEREAAESCHCHGYFNGQKHFCPNRCIIRI